MLMQKPPEAAFREALEARSFWRDAVLHDPELGFLMLDGEGLILSANDNAAEILTGTRADLLMGQRLVAVLAREIAQERLRFVTHALTTGRTLLVTSICRGVRCRCIFRRLPGDAGDCGHILWTTRRAPIPWQPADLHARIDVVEAQAKDWGPLSPLSDEERAMVATLARGAPLQEVAARLELPLETLTRLYRSICAKLNTTDPVRLAQLAIAAGLVDFRPIVSGEV